MTNSLLIASNSTNFHKFQRYIANGLAIMGQCSHTGHSVTIFCFGNQSSHQHSTLHCSSQYHKQLNHLWVRKISGIDTAQCEKAFFSRSKSCRLHQPCFIGGKTFSEGATDRSTLGRNLQYVCSNNLFFLLFFGSLITTLSNRNKYCSYNSPHRAYRLYPSGHSFSNTSSSNYNLQTPAERSQRKKPPYHPNAGQLHVFRHFKAPHHQCPFAITRAERMPAIRPARKGRRYE